ncbi:polysaccharide deacetylase family protein [Natrinema sp. CGMCC1.2065]|uniref:polysaccharide deacetylase family protein n=1 Tax=Natrinema sp. CGMCC1.2065 TaxID=3445767 RepID=UPI003F4A3F20
MRRRNLLIAGLGSCVAGCLSRESTSAPRNDSTGIEPDGNGPSDVDPDDDPAEDAASDAVDPSPLEDFEDLSPWTSDGGTLTADDATYYSGTQAARIDVRPRDRRGAIRRSFAEPVDLTGDGLSLALRATAAIYPRIQLFDTDGNRLDLRAPVRAGVPFQSYPFGIDHDGGCDRSAVSELRILTYTGGGESLSLWCDHLARTPRPDTPVVLFQFDDGSVTDYTQAAPILESHGYPATTFVNPDAIGGRDALDLDQLAELQASGWTVGSHADSHDSLSSLEPAIQEARIRRGKEWLVDHGFEGGAEYFAYPYSDYDATTLELVDEYHRLGFAAGWPATGRVPNRLLAPRRGDPDPAEARRLLDLTIRHDGVLTLLFHSMGDLADAEYHVDDFGAIVDYVHEKERKGDLEVCSVAEFESRLVAAESPAPYR